MIAFELPIKSTINDYILELIEETIPSNVKIIGGDDYPYIIEYKLNQKEPSSDQLEEVFWNLELMATEKFEGSKLFTAKKVLNELKAAIEELPIYENASIINNLKEKDVVRFKTGNSLRLGRIIKILSPGTSVYQGLGFEVFGYRYKPNIKNINKYNAYGLLACIVEIKESNAENKNKKTKFNNKGDLFCVCSKQIISLELDYNSEVTNANEALCQL